VVTCLIALAATAVAAAMAIASSQPFAHAFAA
jgi:hypothetical protein